MFEVNQKQKKNYKKIKFTKRFTILKNHKVHL